MSRLFTVSLYFMSFLPLWISVVFEDIMSIVEKEKYIRTECISIGCILAGMLVSMVVVYCQIHKQGKEGSKKYTIKFVREEKTITAEFLLSYILPLFAFNFTLWKQTVLFLVFFLSFGYLCVKHNYYSINIVLELAGYRFYRCELSDSDGVETEEIIMSRQRLNELVGTAAYVAKLNNDYGIDVSNK